MDYSGLKCPVDDVALLRRSAFEEPPSRLPDFPDSFTKACAEVRSMSFDINFTVRVPAFDQG